MASLFTTGSSVQRGSYVKQEPWLNQVTCESITATKPWSLKQGTAQKTMAHTFVRQFTGSLFQAICKKKSHV